MRLGSRFLSPLLCALALVACAKKEPKTPVGITPEYEIPPEEAPAAEAGAVPADVVARAAQPFSGYRAADARSFAHESFLTHLAAADVVCIGERHDSASDHYAELALIDGLAERRALRGFELGVGFEMVRVKVQGTLDAFLNGTYSLDKFAARSNWKTEWGYPFEYYAPSLEAARATRSIGLALGVDRALTSQVAELGLDGLPPALTHTLPRELDLGDLEHRALFDSLTEGHPHGDPELMYEAQVVWDEAMAERAAAFLAGRAPGRKLIILAGSAHCHRRAIPARLERRGHFRTVSVLPVEAQPVRVEERKPDAPPPSTEQRLLAGYDYQLVFAARSAD